MNYKSILLSVFMVFGIFVNTYAEDVITIHPDARPTGRGNQREILFKIDYNRENANIALKTIKVQLSDIDNITNLYVYSTKNEVLFDERHPENYLLIGNTIPAVGQNSIILTDSIYQGENHLWVVCDVAENAPEGAVISATLNEIETVEQLFSYGENVQKDIMLLRKKIFAPGDYNSTNYRIPAVVTADDGSIVIATDKRKYNQGDLPSDIDILIRRSTDGGKTWSEPITIAQGAGEGAGYGDAALVKGNNENELICVFVGGSGLWESVVTAGKKIRSYMCRSLDNGITWTSPREITDYIYGDGCVVESHQTWKASFFASGAGLRMRNGRIMFVAAIRTTTSTNLSNYAIYSDDNGETWTVGGRACTKGDESKVVELVDGSILMSIRHAGIRWYNISHDGGDTWGNVSSWSEMLTTACDGDMIRYTDTISGFDKNRILHSNPDNLSSRENLTVFLSYDEGHTWAVKKTIIPYGSAYSSLNILPDGTIGIYEEENYYDGNYSTYYMTFSLDWLTNGEDTYHVPQSIENIRGDVDKYHIYPNPAEGYIRIDGEDIAAVRLVDIQGRTASNYLFTGKDVFIDTTILTSGTYFACITDKEGKDFCRKFEVLK